MAVRPRLRNPDQIRRFESISGRYAEICEGVLGATDAPGIRAGKYDWRSLAGQVREAFRSGVPMGFLSNRVIADTMVLARRRGIQYARERIEKVLEAFDRATASCVLLEDYIGLPTIANREYLTSANRSHHASHLAHYALECGAPFWECDSIVEWGGGYGDFARIVRRMNPSTNYTIVDLPELLALQYVYLGTLEGEDRLNVVTKETPVDLAKGRINLVAYDLIRSGLVSLECDGFVSTWALTESPREAQEHVIQREFFGARRVLMASRLDANNYVSRSLDHSRLARFPVPAYGKLCDSNEYWFA